MPPLAVPPSSWSWKLKLAEPTRLRAGTNVIRAVSISLLRIVAGNV